MDNYRCKTDPSKTRNAWQNKFVNEIPDWLQGRGTGQAGGVLTIMTHVGVVKVDPNDYVCINDKNEIHIFSARFFEANYERI